MTVGDEKGILAALKAAALCERRDDVTVYLHRDADDEDVCKALCALSGGTNPGQRSFDISLDVEVTPKKPVRARVQISSCNEGKHWSATIRWDTPDGEAGAQGNWISSKHLGLGKKLTTKWEASQKCFNKTGSSVNLFSIRDVVDELVMALDLVDGKERHGLLLVAGGTGSGKSNIARGVAHQYLAALYSKSAATRRNLHVLTHEDPIELQLFGKRAVSRMGVDYTPRLLGRDTASLTETIKAALRQKPALLYVGEIRDPDDLKGALDFGGTGHLVIATTHAGSLVEAIEKTLMSCEATDPGTRAIWVPKLLGVIHMSRKSLDPSAGNSSTRLPSSLSCLLPALYRNTPLGRQGLIADGLSSLLPYSAGPMSRPGSLGRQHFARALCAREVQGLRAAQAAILQTMRRGHVTTGAGSLVDLALQDDLHGR